MSKEIVEWFGPTPCDENCAQTIESDFSPKNKLECARYMNLLSKAYRPPNDKCGFKVQVETGHDYGTYREVAAWQESEVSEEEQNDINEWLKKVQTSPSTWIELDALANELTMEEYLEKLIKE